MKSRVAVVVEDDADIRGLMAELLGQSGFTVHQASTGAAGVEAVREHTPAVVTVDLGLPDFDGYEVTRRVRQFSDAYVVMLTARTEEIDTLMGLEAGADDYITKPFRPRELRARIEAMLRRPRTNGSLPAIAGSASAVPVAAPAAPLEPADGGAPEPVLPPASGATAGSARSGPWASAHSGPSASVPGAAPSWAPRQASSASAPHAGSAPSAPYADSAAPAPHAGSAAPPPFAGPAAQARLELDGLALYPHLHVVEVAGREIPLTPTEFLLLETLLCSGQVVRSKAQLARALHGDDADAGTFVSKADERTVEVHVGNLRRKLADDPNEPRWIQTVRGVGYRMSGRPVVHG